MAVQSIYTNVDIYKPELWAMESLQILFENIGIRGRVKLDFRNEIAEKGDTINTRIPEIMTAHDVGADGSIQTVEEPQAENIQVVLDRNRSVNFNLRDRDCSLALKDLRVEFMVPSVLGMIRNIEDDGIAKMSNATNGFADETDSHVLEIGTTSTNAPGAFHILAIAESARELHADKVPEGDRHFLIGPQQQYDMLSDTSNTNLLLLKANEASDTAALREGNIGRLFGFDVFMQQGVLAKAASAGSAYPVGATAQQAIYWHRNAVAYVNRMMDDPPAGAGVLSTTQSFMGQALRVQIGYEIRNKQNLVSLDALWGWKVMRQIMGGSVFSRSSGS